MSAFRVNRANVHGTRGASRATDIEQPPIIYERTEGEQDEEESENEDIDLQNFDTHSYDAVLETDIKETQIMGKKISFDPSEMLGGVVDGPRFKHKNGLPRTPKSMRVVRSDKVMVYIRVVFVKLGEIDTIKENFTAEVFMEASWREAALDAMAAEAKSSDINWSRYWTPHLYIDNSLTAQQEKVWHQFVKNDANEAYVFERRRVKGLFLATMELRQFPFDTQDLSVSIISERKTSEVELVEASSEISTVNTQSFVDEQEWELYKCIEVFNDSVEKFLNGSTASHPVITYTCRVSRRYAFYLWNIVLVMNRLQVTFILLLTTVTFKFTVIMSLPRFSYLTYMDKYVFLCISFLCMICIWHALIGNAIYGNGATASTAQVNLDHYLLAALGSFYALVHIIFIFFVFFYVLAGRRHLKQKEKEHKTKISSRPQSTVAATYNSIYRHHASTSA